VKDRFDTLRFWQRPSDPPQDGGFRVSWTRRRTLLASAALLGVDACAMEGIDPAEFDRILRLEGSDYGTVVGVAAGYRSPDDQTQFAPKVRFRSEEVMAVA
jgi:nitroreductase